jgi:hypothetical protein
LNIEGQPTVFLQRHFWQSQISLAAKPWLLPFPWDNR